MKPQPFDLPDLRKLSPEDRKAAFKKYKASQSQDFSHQNTKADVAARKSAFNDRLAVRVRLVNAGCMNGDDQVEELSLMLQSKWASIGHERTVEAALNRLATDPDSLTEMIGEYRIAFPQNFVDVSSAERMPASKQFQAKVRIISRHVDNLVGGERRQAPLIAKAQARGAVQPETSRVSMPLPPT